MKRYRFADILFAAMLLVTVLLLLMNRAPFRLEFKEQISIFLLGADRIDWYLSNPAVVSSIAGDWLTQFFIKGWVGSVLSILLLMTIVAGLARLFKLSEPGKTVCWMLLMIPVVIEGYFITFPNYPVSATVGLALSVWIACALAHIKDSKYSCFVYGLSIPVMYVIAGGHALTLALLLGFLKRKDGVKPLACLLAGIAVMLVCGKFYNLTLLQTLIWPIYPGYINPDVSLLLLLPWLILIMMLLTLFYDRFKDAGWTVGVYVTIISIICSVDWISGKSELENTVKIGTLAYREQWKEVKKMASQELSGGYGSFYWNLCNAREGALADGLLKGRWGKSANVLFLSTTKGDPYFSMMYFTDALLEMGDVSQATDCALLAQTVMPGHYSTRMLRRLAQIAVVTADYDVARKYLNILMRTRNHKEWARNLLDCIEKDNLPEQYLTWRSRTVPVDRFFGQGDIPASLSIIASQVPYNRTAIDYLLCSYLLDKKINTFISLYNEYYLGSLDQVVRVPDLYQEALLVNVDSKESLMETVQKYHLSQKVVDNYIDLLDARSKSANPETLITKDAVGTYWNYIMAVRFNNTEQQ